MRVDRPRARRAARASASGSSSRSSAARAAATRAAPGLGLAIARGFAEANGGRVWVESRAGQGATFVLALPAVARVEVAGVSGQRVLVVDDEQQILRALRTSLRGAGYEVDTAETAEAALAAAALRPPEAVILDLVLPDGTGHRRLPRAAHAGARAPVILLSAVGEEREKVAALDAGADDYVDEAGRHRRAARAPACRAAPHGARAASP